MEDIRQAQNKSSIHMWQVNENNTFTLASHEDNLLCTKIHSNKFKVKSSFNILRIQNIYQHNIVSLKKFATSSLTAF